MLDSLRASYDALPYPHGSVPLSHPARLGAIGRLLGLTSALPEKCSVLEIGCGIGMNLLPLAERFPQADFVGIDLSDVQIDFASRALAATGIKNVQLIAGDLREFLPEVGQFDYVIAHGFYSWTTAEAADRLLAVCHHALAPHGVAYVSYNTYPGWGAVEGLRRVLLTELDREATMEGRVARAQQLIDALSRSFAAEPGAYAAQMREVLAEMKAKSIALTLHDELDPATTATTFTEFVAHAARHDLHFLSEAHFASMPVDHLSPQARAPLADLGLDFARSQQFLDLLGQRRFRATLLTKQPIDHPRALNEAEVRNCALSTSLRLEQPEVDLSPGATIHLIAPRGIKFALQDPAQKAFLAGLISRAPEPVRFSEAVDFARGCLAQAGIDAPIDELQLIRAVCRLFAIDGVDLLLAGTPNWLAAAEPARLSPLVQFCARENLPLINRWHQTVDLSDDERRWIAKGEGVVDLERIQVSGILA